MMLSILKKIGYTINHDDPFQAMMWNLFLTSFFLMLRKSNVRKTSGTEEKYLRCSHISRKGNHILVQIFWTKKLQLGEKVSEMPLLSIPGCSLCQVKAMKRMVQLIPSKPSMPLFANVDGSPITYPVYMKFLKEKINEIGLDKTNFSTHSFRRGAVSWAIKCGIPESLIQVMRDWKSDCYKMYINCLLDVRCKFVEKIGHYWLFMIDRKLDSNYHRHDIVIKNCTLISFMGTPMHRFLEALEDKEVDLGRYNLFILVLGYNDLELDRLFFDIYYKLLLMHSNIRAPLQNFSQACS